MRSYARRLRRLEEAAGVTAGGGCQCPPEILIDFKGIGRPDGDLFCVRCRTARQLVCMAVEPTPADGWHDE